MKHTDPKTEWDAYCKEEIEKVLPVLSTRGFSLEAQQPHLGGERYLMQAVTTASGRKLILLGHDDKGEKVIIKATRDDKGSDELEHERACREILTRIDFAGEVFHTPTEIAFYHKNGFTISIQSFIEQTSTFLERPLKEQFLLALRAFKGQESAHAATWEHRALIGKAFGIRNADTYIRSFEKFRANVRLGLSPDHPVHDLLQKSSDVLSEQRGTIEQYCGFLTHTDFVPHNIRIKNDTIYLLDHSSLTFGNKYEGWARFINFMALYNPPLESALMKYVTENRTKEESVSLHMMRIYRLGELIHYYTDTLKKSVGNLNRLNTARIDFWSCVLGAALRGEQVSPSVIEGYTKKRDELRSDEEKRRQIGLH